MSKYEYRVVAAPTRGVKAKGIKSYEARFAHALEEMMNSMAAEGWEYQRAETLPSVERSGLTSTTTTWRNVLVFRKLIETAQQGAQDFKGPELGSPTALLALDAPVPSDTTETETETRKPNSELPPVTTPQTPDDDASESEGASRMLRDNGVEELSEVSGVSSSLKKLAENRNYSKASE